MKTIAIIPARGGSKGVPKKNIKMFAGKPLIAWTIEAAMASNMIDDIVVSTDSEEIKEVSQAYGAKVPFLRPMEISNDWSHAIDAVLFTLKHLVESNFTHCCLLQPTSPLRTCSDIDDACIIAGKKNSKSLISVTENVEYPFVSTEIIMGKLLRPKGCSLYLPRQEVKIGYHINGAIYVNTIKHLFHTKSFYSRFMDYYLMPEERSFQIDTQLDFDITEYLKIRELDEAIYKTETCSKTVIQKDFLL